MPSISSAKLIKERTLNLCRGLGSINNTNVEPSVVEEINTFFQKEYQIIPDKDRIGKGAVYISKHISKALVSFLKSINKPSNYFLSLSDTLFNYGLKNEDIKIRHLAIYIFAEFIFQFPNEFEKNIKKVIIWANDDEWQIRESTGEIILSSLKKDKDKTLTILSKFAVDSNENIRRLVSESLRPRSDINWLRDPLKNDIVLNLLTVMKKDPSIYVRKSVGNNIKDLTKYMPEKMLDLMERWLKGTQISIKDDLASEEGLNKDQKRLIWTIKQAMRWIKERNSEFHPQLEKILGKNYVSYFNEKRNRLAKPT